jgi:hypothetical protein
MEATISPQLDASFLPDGGVLRLTQTMHIAMHVSPSNNVSLFRSAQ